MTPMEAILLRRIYDTERQLLERNFAKGHSFEEWVDQQSLGSVGVGKPTNHCDLNQRPQETNSTVKGN